MQSKASIVGIGGEWAKRSPPLQFSCCPSFPANYRPTMLHFTITFKTATGKPVIRQDVHCETLENAMTLSMNYCCAHTDVWQAEIENKVGCVLRICVGAQHKPCGAFMQSKIKRVLRSEKVCKTDVQLKLF